MANSGSFRKGIKRPNQGKHGPPKAALRAREAIALLVESNLGKLQSWLDLVALEDGPRAAFECFMKLLEYHVPKIARHELAAAEPVQMIVRWKNSTD